MRSYIYSNNKYDINGNAIPNKFISPLGNEVTLYFPSPLHLDNIKVMKFQYAEHRLYIVRLIFQHHLEIIN